MAAAWVIGALVGPAHPQDTAAEVEEESEALDPAALRADSADAEAQLAHALWETHLGRLGAAVVRLEALAASGTDAVLERAVRERERIAALLAARDARLAAAAAAGARIPLQRGSERAQAKVVAFADGVVKLGNNRFSLESIAADELSCAELLKEDSLPLGMPGWVRAYALLLAREKDWDKALPAAGAAGDEAASSALRSDANDLDSRLRLGRAVEELDQLSRAAFRSGGPEAGAQAQATIDRACAVVRELADVPFVAARRAPLRALATDALGARFDADPGVPGLRGRGQRLDGGLVRISYGFDDAKEIEDFVLVPGALPDWHQSMLPVEKPIADSYLIARQGAFFGDGQVTYRHALDFAAPVRVRYAMRYVEREGDPVDVGVVMIGLAWDGVSSFVSASDFGDVYATEYELGRGERAICEGERAVKVGEVYEVEARLETGPDGATIQGWRGGSQRKQLSAGALRSGGLFLFVHTPRIVAFESLEIEGRPESFSLRALRERWVASQLAELGL